MKKLKTILAAKNEDFRSLGKNIPNKEGELIFIDRGSDILGVAHLDTVMERPPRFVNNYVICPQLDDRLGVWALLNLNLKIDILLTDNEEVGRSTGQFFKPDKQYNWIFSFDRAGNDAVTYDYSDSEWDYIVNEFFPVGWGSFSDITMMEHLGCKGVNFGIGYRQQHSDKCYADLKESIGLVNQFRQFFNKYKDTYFKHEESESIFLEDVCDHCSREVKLEWSYCPWCGQSLYTDWPKHKELSLWKSYNRRYN